MTYLGKTFLLGAALVLAACSDPARFDGASGGGGADAGGGSAAAQNPSSPAYFQQTVGDRVLFEVDQSSLTDTGRETLEGQAEWLISNTEYNAVIEGHADEQGTREYNLALGARRATTVQDYLINQGVSASRLKVVSYGKERPIEICSNESCYAKNRRAVTVISPAPTS